LLDSNRFKRFCFERAQGNYDIKFLCDHTLLIPDRLGATGESFFHPFRLAILMRINHITSFWKKDPTPEQEQMLSARIMEWTRIIDLCVILEPIFWPRVTNWLSRNPLIPYNEFYRMRNSYRTKVLILLGTLSQEDWEQAHNELCIAANFCDS